MAAGPTYEPYAKITVSADTSSVTFSSINGSFTDLVLTANWKADTSGVNLQLQYNGDTNTSNYADMSVYQDETANAEYTEGQVAGFIRVGYWSTTQTGDFSVSKIDIQNYSNTTTYKPLYVRWGATDYHLIRVGQWKSTSAINSIKLFPSSGNIKSGSEFTIYAITAA
jgi:hypothetical protein